MKLPDQFKPHVDGVTAAARMVMADGGDIPPSVMFISGDHLYPMPMVGTDKLGKDMTAELVKMLAARFEDEMEQPLDGFLIAMEAWVVELDKDDPRRHDPRLHNGASLETFPGRLDCFTIQLETRLGIWTGKAPIVKAGEGRTFGEIELELADGAEGRFVGLLPPVGPKQ